MNDTIINESKVLGEGTYGCVHYPSLRCKLKKNIDYNNKVSKLTLNNEAKIELKEYNLISKIDKKKNIILENL